MIARFQDIYQQIYDDHELNIDEDLLAAVVLGFIGNQNIMIGSRHVGTCERALRQISTNVFGMTPLTVNCTEEMTWHNVCKAMTSTGRIHRFVIFANLDRASTHLQLSLLNALIKRRIPDDGKHYILPPTFLGIALFSTKYDSDSLHFNSHLKQHFYFLHIFEHEEDNINNTRTNNNKLKTIISEEYLKYMRYKAQQLTVTVDVKRYMHDIAVFARTHRLVRGGVSTKACKDLDTLVRGMATLQDYTFATPSIVSLAARKVLPIKLDLCKPVDEPSLQYGGELKVVAKWMQKWDKDLVVDDVLNNVKPPI